jgi:hypothetical protein
MFFSTRKVGGIRFFRLWRLRFSFCIAVRERVRPRALQQTPKSRITGIPDSTARAPAETFLERKFIEALTRNV